MKHLLQLSFLFFLVASLSIVSYSQNNDLDKAQTLYQKFQENRKGNNQQQKSAYESAKEFVLSMTDVCSDVVSYVQLWIEKYELSQKVNFDITDWHRFKRCGFTFLAPLTLKDFNAKGIDSCVASFGNENISLNLAYGWYAEKVLNHKDRFTDFNEEDFEINGKKARFSTYAISGNHAFVEEMKFIAEVYVHLKNNTSLNMKLAGKTRKDVEIAKQIFSTIKFDK